jgi:hypothetical protein
MDNLFEKGQHHIFATLAVRLGHKCIDIQKYCLTDGYGNGKGFILTSFRLNLLSTEYKNSVLFQLPCLSKPDGKLFCRKWRISGRNNYVIFSTLCYCTNVARTHV